MAVGTGLFITVMSLAQPGTVAGSEATLVQAALLWPKVLTGLAALTVLP
ncbi:MAG TPA: hypothetical protein P5279_16650 [Anaerohalosphaeraceae bacterium]|jgi:hypothetical protein|nr:hypothetical protein [Anaerohalosphaeraceae bacterium]HRT52120.1 hypothetical protein [Anaerohalosphaeraceae bacterium]HRT87964.1 hypothetical protein [Anaerohalosphaeraceae bacterium]